MAAIGAGLPLRCGLRPPSDLWLCSQHQIINGGRPALLTCLGRVQPARSRSTAGVLGNDIIADLREIATLLGNDDDFIQLVEKLNAVADHESQPHANVEARKILYSILEARDEGAQLAAAEGLAKIGDDGGKKVLESVLANEAMT